MVGDLFRGFGYAARGYRLLRRYPELSRFWIWPIALTAVALGAGLYLSLHYHEALTNMLWAEPEGEGFWHALRVAAHWLLEAIVFAASLVLTIVICSGASSIVAAPFNDALSEAIEQRETGKAPPPFSFARLTRDLLRTVRLESSKLALYVLVMAPMWVLSFLVPGIGQILYLVLGALFTATYFAIDYVDWPASRRGLGIRARLALFRARPALMLGFGFSLSLLLFVPLLNLLMMPIAVAGGTRLFLDLTTSSEQLTAHNES